MLPHMENITLHYNISSHLIFEVFFLIVPVKEREMLLSQL